MRKNVWCYHANPAGKNEDSDIVKLRCVDENGTKFVLRCETEGYLYIHRPEEEQLIGVYESISSYAIRIYPKGTITLKEIDVVESGLKYEFYPALKGLSIEKDIVYSGCWLNVIFPVTRNNTINNRKKVIDVKASEVFRIITNQREPTTKLFWDTETRSSKSSVDRYGYDTEGWKKGRFSNPHNLDDNVTMITFVIKTDLDISPLVPGKKYIFILEWILALADREKVQADIVKTFAKESEMVTMFLDIFKRCTHEIQFNGIGYDINYLLERELLLTGTISNHSGVPSLKKYYYSSIDLFRNRVLMIHTPDVVHVDLLQAARLLYPGLPRHKLEFISTMLLGTGKLSVSFDDYNTYINGTSTKEGNKEMLTHFIDYAVNDAVLLIDLYAKINSQLEYLCELLSTTITILLRDAEATYKMIDETLTRYSSVFLYMESSRQMKKQTTVMGKYSLANLRPGIYSNVHYYSLSGYYKSKLLEASAAPGLEELASDFFKAVANSKVDVLVMHISLSVVLDLLKVEGSPYIAGHSVAGILSTAIYNNLDKPYLTFDRVIIDNSLSMVMMKDGQYYTSPSINSVFRPRTLLDKLFIDKFLQDVAESKGENVSINPPNVNYQELPIEYYLYDITNFPTGAIPPKKIVLESISAHLPASRVPMTKWYFCTTAAVPSERLSLFHLTAPLPGSYPLPFNGVLPYAPDIINQMDVDMNRYYWSIVNLWNNMVSLLTTR